jgi:mono/diheme cytochrome c family protein
MKRLLGITALVGIATMAMAMAGFNKVFDTNYKVEKSSALGKASCGLCHASAKGGKLNPYGADLAAEMKKAGSKKLTPAILKAVEGMDSDKDGKSNLDEIKADTHPGK